ncbi:MAG: class II aldolase/adducin family protein [bacterium]|nr:class II aldolase/adducin family protein [bacterium]
MNESRAKESQAKRHTQKSRDAGTPGPLEPEAAREAVVATCLQLADLGFLAGIGGNLAIRTTGGCFAVTPSAADYYALEPADICILKLDSLEKIAGEMEPSVESGMHAALLQYRPDLQASVHTHQPIASAVALLNRRLEVRHPAARAALGASIELTSYAPSGTGFLVNAFRKVLLADVNGYILRNHGIVCGAPDLKQAVRNVQHIENEAARYLRCAISDAKASKLPAYVQKQVLASL